MGRTMEKKISDSNAMIVGLAKNCAPGLIKSLPRLDRFNNTFRHVDFRIMINDSVDETEKVLDDWSKGKDNIKIIKQSGLDRNVPNRTARLAVCRNICLEELRHAQLKNEYDYYIVLDLDGLNATLIDDPEFTSIVEAAPSGWGALFANQSGVYYDIWALRHPTWCPTDCFVEIKKYRRNPINWIKNFGRRRTREVAYKRYLWDRQSPIPSSSDFIEVLSAFGGFGIYKVKYLNGAHYRGIPEDIKIDKLFGPRQNNQQVCEHVFFNARISNNGGRLYIAPNLQNSTHE